MLCYDDCYVIVRVSRSRLNSRLKYRDIRNRLESTILTKVAHVISTYYSAALNDTIFHFERCIVYCTVT